MKRKDYVAPLMMVISNPVASLLYTASVDGVVSGAVGAKGTGWYDDDIDDGDNDNWLMN